MNITNKKYGRSDMHNFKLRVVRSVISHISVVLRNTTKSSTLCMDTLFYLELNPVDYSDIIEYLIATFQLTKQKREQPFFAKK